MSTPTAAQASDLPVNIGFVVYPGFQALDVFGPLDPLNMLSMEVPLKLSIIGPTLEPVSTKAPPVVPTVSPDFAQSIVPTHTFASPPKDLDVLIVPGGAGLMYPVELQQAQIDFVKEQYPKLKYLISVCAGASLLARAGVLDGKRATTTKAGWAWTTSTGPNVNWVPKARWVVDGNIWTTSGVVAGIDGIFAWISHVYGEDLSLKIANTFEFERHTDASYDPFADVWNVSTSVAAQASTGQSA
ncbi:class I glutamine amidotransferase-like protein [Exidia glandulosa HHB12029]|uniref:Class I glutamine amidotransferase-like protein n=1 Tax=Exidia glandulosa HHB12029 TaxID=1314781 RepID=A0A165NFR5_EXIGL|nr:class I glutamine amidotransferase-like protein [Exidia glandulosa HHB12029]